MNVCYTVISGVKDALEIITLCVHKHALRKPEFNIFVLSEM